MHNCVVDTWLDEIDALFTEEIWNDFENNAERTNNYVEEFHSKLNRRASLSYLNL